MHSMKFKKPISTQTQSSEMTWTIVFVFKFSLARILSLHMVFFLFSKKTFYITLLFPFMKSFFFVFSLNYSNILVLVLKYSILWANFLFVHRKRKYVENSLISVKSIEYYKINIIFCAKLIYNYIYLFPLAVLQSYDNAFRNVGIYEIAVLLFSLQY